MRPRVGEVVPGRHMDRNCISSSEVVAFEDEPCAFVFFCLFAFLMPGCLGSLMPLYKKKKNEIFEKTALSLNASFSIYSLPTFQQSILILLNLFSHLLRRKHLKGT